MRPQRVDRGDLSPRPEADGAARAPRIEATPVGAPGSTSRWSVATPHCSKLARVRCPKSSSPTLPTKRTCDPSAAAHWHALQPCAQLRCQWAGHARSGRAEPPRTFAPNVAAATAWFAPFPPHAVQNDVPCAIGRQIARVWARDRVECASNQHRLSRQRQRRHRGHEVHVARAHAQHHCRSRAARALSVAATHVVRGSGHAKR